MFIGNIFQRENDMDTIQHKIWPAVKMRLIYWWWILKYRGKKNIPPELIFGKLEETMKSLSDNVLKAIQASPENMSEEERKMAHDLLTKLQEFEKGVADIKKDQRTDA